MAFSCGVTYNIGILAIVGVLLALDPRPGRAEEAGTEACGGGDAPRCAERGQREIMDKTPTPCQDKYDDELITSAAEEHLRSFRCGHATPQMLLLLGGSGSGKTTFLRHLEKHGLQKHMVVPHGLDEYLDYVPEYRKTVSDPDFVYVDAADACYGGGAIPIAKAVQERIIDRRCHLFYEETGKNLNRIVTRVLPPFTAAGYRLTIVLVDNAPSIAKERAVDRFRSSGRYASDDYIDGTFKDVFANYLTLREMDVVEETVYCDNSCVNLGGESKNKKPGMCLRCWEHTATSWGKSTGSFIPAEALSVWPIEFMPPHQMPTHAHDEA